MSDVHPVTAYAILLPSEGYPPHRVPQGPAQNRPIPMGRPTCLCGGGAPPPPPLPRGAPGPAGPPPPEDRRATRAPGRGRPQAGRTDKNSQGAAGRKPRLPHRREAAPQPAPRQAHRGRDQRVSSRATGRAEPPPLRAAPAGTGQAAIPTTQEGGDLAGDRRLTGTSRGARKGRPQRRGHTRTGGRQPDHGPATGSGKKEKRTDPRMHRWRPRRGPRSAHGPPPRPDGAINAAWPGSQGPPRATPRRGARECEASAKGRDRGRDNRPSTAQAPERGKPPPLPRSPDIYRNIAEGRSRAGEAGERSALGRGEVSTGWRRSRT